MLTNRNVVKQSYSLNNASYRLSSLAFDLIFGMITEIKQDDADFKPFRFSLVELEKKFGKRINQKYLENLSEEMLSTVIKIKKETGFLHCNWVSSFEYFLKDRVVELSFDPKLKPYLLSVKDHFVLTDFSQMLLLKGGYSKRIFMLVKQRENLTSWRVSVEELQTLLMVPDSFKVYKAFKQKILTPSLQINEKTDFSFSFKEIKNGRKVEYIEFFIKNKNQSKPTTTPLKCLDNWLNSPETGK